MEEIRSALLEILEELHPDQEFEGINTLVTDKVLDSFDVVVSADKIIPENFNSVDALCELIRSLLDED